MLPSSYFDAGSALRRHRSLVWSFLTCSGRAVPTLDSLAPDDRLGLIMGGRKNSPGGCRVVKEENISSLELSMIQRQRPGGTDLVVAAKTHR